MRLRTFVSDHLLASSIVVAAVIGLGIFVFTYFEPHKLFIDETVDEALPGTSETPTSGEGERATGDDDGEDARSGESDVVASGPFHGLEHDTSGKAVLLELPDGRRFLRLEDFETSNGPDLRVYLSEIPAGDDWFVYGERFVDLGALKGNIGNQNYEIPADVDLDTYVSAVVWCRQFSVGFGVAPLET